MAEAFLPNEQNLPVVNHIDGIKTNNAVTNLEWCTHKQNSSHAKMMGLLADPKRGVDNHCAKLTEDDVKHIRSVFIPKSRVFGARALGRKFGVSKSTIMKIINKEKWGWL